MKQINIWVDAKRIFYWSNLETKDRKRGGVQMFDTNKSIFYYAFRDGSAYIAKYRSKYRIKTNSDPSSALVNNDTLVALCVKSRTTDSLHLFSEQSPNEMADNDADINSSDTVTDDYQSSADIYKDSQILKGFNNKRF